MGIDDLFETVIVSEAVGCRKPERAIFEMACKELAVNPEHRVFAGDNPIANIQGAGALGMHTVFIPIHLHGKQCIGANTVCRNYSDLLSNIENAQSDEFEQSGLT